MSKSVQNIIVERLLEKIAKDKVLPWQKPFAFASINWFSEREYVGINKFLLDGGEYITPKQLETYNLKNKTNYWFDKGTPYELVVYYGPTFKELTADQEADLAQNGAKSKIYNKVRHKDGKAVLVSWILRYYKVYNITYIKDKEGNTLPSKMGRIFEERVTAPEEIIEKYVRGSGVKISEESIDAAYYTEVGDRVVIPKMTYFNSNEAYYRVLFHELSHSTGIEKRLNRECFKKYHETKEERSREELIAEISSLLLSSEAGFKEDTDLAKNSENYIAGWVKWMKENAHEVVLGMQQAEKTKNYILNGGSLPSYTNDMDTEADI